MTVGSERKVSSGVAIVGAGPYGLAVAAALRRRGIGFRIFGTPMQAWREDMPRGMFLKSEGFASSIADPDGVLTLARFCGEHDLGYGDYGVPVPVDTFIRYGLWFQHEGVGEVEETGVRDVSHAGDGFELTLDSGEGLRARAVVVASGLNGFAFVPKTLRNLPAEACSHSSRHHDLGVFRGKRVVVVGGGQSALETAALLHEGGATATVVVRKPGLAWNPTPLLERSAKHRLRYPRSGLGDGWDLWFYANLPLAFHSLPAQRRAATVSRTLGPAGSWWLRDRLDGAINIRLSAEIREARAESGRVRLRTSGDDDGENQLEADHVIAATGYRPDVDRVPYLDPELRSRIARSRAGPALSRWFESSVPGLYFVGLAAATSFGPAQRFVLGSDVAARRVGKHVARSCPSPPGVGD